jgi:hypothetical protein
MLAVVFRRVSGEQTIGGEPGATSVGPWPEGESMIKRVQRGGMRRATIWAMAAVAAVLMTAVPARAQMGGEWQQINDPPINSREVELMGRMLKLDTTQQELVNGLNDALQAEFEKLASIVRAMMDQVRKEAEESQNNGVWRELGKKLQQFQDKKKSLQEQFFADVKLVLTDEQVAAFPSFERRWYRGRQLGNQQMGFLSAMRADIVVLTEELSLNEEAKAQIAPVIDAYEREVDRELREFEKLTEEQKEQWEKITESGDWMGNMDKMNELFSELRDKLIKVRDLNVRYRDQVTVRLEGEAKAKFDAAYDKAAFPSLYKDTFVDSGIRTVLEMPDVTAEQKTEIVAIQDRVSDEMAALNKRLEKAMLEADSSIKIQDFWGGPKQGPVADLEAAKKKLLNERYAQLRALLTEGQVAKLPAAEGEDWRNTQFEDF